MILISMRKYSLSALFALLILAACSSPSADRETPNGVPYTIHTAGDGEKLVEGMVAYIHVNMRTTDSLLFSTQDAGETQAVPVPPDSIPGDQMDPVRDVLRFLSVGDSATLTFQIDTIPQFQLPPALQGQENVYYDVTVYEALDEVAFQARQEAKQAELAAVAAEVRERGEERRSFANGVYEAYKTGTLEDVQTTESGLSYVIHEQGSGARPEPNQGVSVHYIGMLTADGSIFDQSFLEGNPIQFPIGVGRVIPGWDEGIALLTVGSKAKLIIPANLGYGARGAGGVIPPNATLIFEVELVAVQ